MSRLLVLPDAAGSAVANMATDLTLLERALAPGVLLFRHYTWTEPAFTFGVSQSLEFARGIAGPGVTLVRRATGGGVVDHRSDWTYALLAHASHPLAAMKATASYRLVHEAVAAALSDAGVAAALVPCPRESCGPAPDSAGAPPVAPRKPGACFLEPEIHDVVCLRTGRKLAGAAQKRTREGILFQGYIDRDGAFEADWDAFVAAFVRRLADAFGCDVSPVATFPYAAGADAEALALFASPAWNARR